MQTSFYDLLTSYVITLLSVIHTPKVYAYANDVQEINRHQTSGQLDRAREILSKMLLKKQPFFLLPGLYQLDAIDKLWRLKEYDAASNVLSKLSRMKFLSMRFETESDIHSHICANLLSEEYETAAINLEKLQDKVTNSTSPDKDLFLKHIYILEKMIIEKKQVSYSNLRKLVSLPEDRICNKNGELKSVFLR